MVKKVMTKKQHYYPRCLLKYFADEYDEVNVYIRQANKLSKVNYERLCFSDYSYESDDTIDNILENKLGHYEAKMGAIVNDILNHFSDEDFTVTSEQQEFLYIYMWLQYLRTDAGRINFITMYENIFSYKPRTLPIELAEIKENQEKIKKFNKLFKQDGVLENYLQFKKMIA